MPIVVHDKGAGGRVRLSLDHSGLILHMLLHAPHHLSLPMLGVEADA
jgi:hypothetical protein